jgi:hypothetical protein
MKHCVHCGYEAADNAPQFLKIYTGQDPKGFLQSTDICPCCGNDGQFLDFIPQQTREIFGL